MWPFSESKTFPLGTYVLCGRKIINGKVPDAQLFLLLPQNFYCSPNIILVCGLEVVDRNDIFVVSGGKATEEGTARRFSFPTFQLFQIYVMKLNIFKEIFVFCVEQFIH